jgi:homoserine O-acetyltransferase
MSWPREAGRHALGDLTLDSGAVLPGATLSWKTHGTLSPARDNVVLYPTSYSARHPDLEWLIGPEGVLDPGRWFIVIPDMFGNGLSSSPSNTEGYPALVTAADNVHAQRRLLAERFGIDRLHAAYGWSMGAQQSYHWAALYPDLVGRVVVNCGSARTAVHNQVFLLALMAILEAAPEYDGRGGFTGVPVAAFRAFGRVYATMALSHAFYREGRHLSALGHPDLETYLTRDWQDRYLQRNAADLLAQLRTWHAGDISANALYGGDLHLALASITANVLLMPGETDQYFRVADNAAELTHLRHAALRPIPSIWGHRAGNPAANPVDAAFVRAQVRDWLAH